MFGWDQRQRLQRRNWGADAEGLSEELFAMFSPQVPNTTEAPVQVSLPNGNTEAPFQIGNVSNRPDDSVPVFSITRNDGSPFGNISISGDTFVFTSGTPGATPRPMGGGGGGGGVPVWG